MRVPKYTPSIHRSFHNSLCAFSAPLSGGLSSTIFPSSAIGSWQRLPLTSLYEVLPQSRTTYRVITEAACLIIQGTTTRSRSIFWPSRLSKCDLSVLTNPPSSWMARSTLALELLSPTFQFSIAAPWLWALPLASLMACWTSTMLGSWSLLSTSLHPSSPQVSRSSMI